MRATPGDGQIRLTWPAQSAATSWEYQQQIGGGSFGDWTAVPNSGASTAGYTLTGLANGFVHTFRVRALDFYGTGPAGQVAAAPVGPPAKPRGTRAVAGNFQVELEWTPDPNADDWQYRQKLQSAQNFSGWITIPRSNTSTSFHIVTGLRNGSTFVFQVRGRNRSGAGPSSNDLAATPNLAVPQRFNNVEPQPGDRQVLLRFREGVPTGLRLLWEYQQKESADPDWGAWIQTPLRAYIKTGILVRNLTNGTSYDFRVRQRDSSGPAVASDPVSATPAVPSSVPAKPVFSVWGDPLGRGGIVFLVGRRGSATSYEWQSALGQNSFPICGNVTDESWGEWQALPQLSGRISVVTNYVRGYSQCYRIRGVNSFGAGPPADRIGLYPVLQPIVPTLTATAGLGQVQLSWPADEFASGWEYRQWVAGGFDSSDWSGVPGSSASTNGYTVPNLIDGTEYFFQVRTLAAGNLPTGASNEVSATPGPTFGDAAVDDQTWIRNTAITALQLPTATGGDGDLIYSLAGRLPAGVSLRGSTFELTGTPTAYQDAAEYTWTARDASGNTATLTFDITVTAPDTPPVFTSDAAFHRRREPDGGGHGDGDRFGPAGRRQSAHLHAERRGWTPPGSPSPRSGC